MKELKYVGKEKVRLLGPQIVTGKAKPLTLKRPRLIPELLPL